MFGVAFLRTLADLAGDIGRAHRAVAVFEQLDGLSDRALAARGLTRGDLPAEALEAGFGRARRNR